MAPRHHWLVIYIIINIAATIMMATTGELVGDAAGNLLYSTQVLMAALILVILSYFLILGPIFKIFSKLKIKKFKFASEENKSNDRIGIILLVLSITYIIYNTTTGGNLAGRVSETSGNPLRIIWVIFPVDALFFVYYGFCRENKYFYFNLVVWLISNLLRGWAGMILFVAFFEWCRAIRNKKISMAWTGSILIAMIVLNPILTMFKYLIRSSSLHEMDTSTIWQALSVGTANQNIFNIIKESVSAIISRLQVVSNLVEVIHFRHLLQIKFNKGEILPFWLEGMHGDYIYKLIGNKPSSITALFPNYYGYLGGNELEATNINISFPGWCFIAPHLIMYYFIFIFILCFASVYLVKKIMWTEGSKDMVWLLWLMFLLPPWFVVYITHLYALCVFFLLKIIFSKNKRRWSSRFQSNPASIS